MDFATLVFETVCAELGADVSKLSANFSFVSRKEIKRLNRTFRGKDMVTDVLSFPALNLVAGTLPTCDAHMLDFNREINKLELGDVVICRAIARSNLRKYGSVICDDDPICKAKCHDSRCNKFDDEITWLLIHGLLHLFGYDHLSDEDMIIMTGLTRKIFNRYKTKERD